MDEVENEEEIARKWLGEIANKNRSGFCDLYDCFSARLYTIALKIIGNPRDASEILQDTFVAIWDGAERYDAQKSSVFSWMVLILRRRAINRLRDNSRRIPGPHEDPTASLDLDNSYTNLTPDQEMEKKEESTAINDVVGRLPNEQKEVIELAFFSGWTHDEIAENLSLPIGTVKSRIRLALEKLRIQIK